MLFDEKGTGRAVLAATNDKGPALDLYDERRTLRASLEAFRDGPRLALLDEKGKPRASLAAFEDESGLALLDEKETIRALFGLENPGTGATEATGPSSITLFDKGGKTIWRAP